MCGTAGQTDGESTGEATFCERDEHNERVGGSSRSAAVPCRRSLHDTLSLASLLALSCPLPLSCLLPADSRACCMPCDSARLGACAKRSCSSAWLLAAAEVANERGERGVIGPGGPPKEALSANGLTSCSFLLCVSFCQSLASLHMHTNRLHLQFEQFVPMNQSILQG